MGLKAINDGSGGGGGGANTALSNLSAVAINTSLVSDTDNTDDLGSTTKYWKDLFLKGVGYIRSILAAPAAASPVALNIAAGGARGGTDSDTAGANFTIQAGQGTGAGAASSVIVQTPAVAGSGSTAQTQTTRLTITEGLSTFVGGMKWSAQMIVALTRTTASATITLTTASTAYQFVDCNGADRNIDLPTPGSEKYGFVIKNVGSANTLTVRDAAAATVTTLAADASCVVIYDGTAWELLS